MRHCSVSLVTAFAITSAGACQGTTAVSIVESSSPKASDEEAGWILLGVGVGALAISATSAVTTQGQMSGYLEQHQTDVEVALARGSGPFVSDVAELLHARRGDVPVLGDTLRAARPELVARLHAAGPERAPAFWHELFAALGRAPATRPIVRARLAEIGAGTGVCAAMNACAATGSSP